MNVQLKKTIANFVFDNEKEFQLNNTTTEHFRPYIFDVNGNYLIGGEEVSNFITEIIKIAKK